MLSDQTPNFCLVKAETVKSLSNPCKYCLIFFVLSLINSWFSQGILLVEFIELANGDLFQHIFSFAIPAGPAPYQSRFLFR